MCRSLVLLLLFSLALIFSSCSQKNDVPMTKVTFLFDKSAFVNVPAKSTKTSKDNKQNKNNKAARGTWGQTSPAAITGYNCFAVFASWSPFSSGNSCINAAGSTLANPELMVGTFPITTPYVTLSIPSGVGRIFQVVGFYSADNTCPSISYLTTADRAKLSAPAILGSTVTNLTMSDQNVTLTMSLSTRQEIAECNGPTLAWNAASSSTTPYIANIQIQNGRIQINGTDLNNISSIALTGGAYNGELLSIDAAASSTSSLLVGGATNAINILRGVAYTLAITDANAVSSTYAVNVTGEIRSVSTSYTASAITSADSGTQYLISYSGTSGIDFPCIGNQSLGDGFILNLKNLGSTPANYNLCSGEVIDSTTDNQVLLSQGATSFVSYNGNWYSIYNNGLSATNNELTCIGYGLGSGGTSSNCYLNSTILNYKVAYVGGNYFYWVNSAWVKGGTANEYLVNDKATVVIQETSTNKNFAVSGAAVLPMSNAYKSNVSGTAYYQTSYVSGKTYAQAVSYCSSLGMQLPTMAMTYSTLGTPGINSGIDATWTQTTVSTTYVWLWEDSMPDISDDSASGAVHDTVCVRAANAGFVDEDRGENEIEYID